MTQPLITAMMLTGKCIEREHMAMVAVRCFLSQSYVNKRLLIINQGRQLLTADNVEKLAIFSGYPPHYILTIADEVPVTRLDNGSTRNNNCPTLGHMRNVGLKYTDKDGLVCIWDDDDWMAEDYMDVLYEAYRHSPGHIIVPRRQIRYDMQMDSAFVTSNMGGNIGQTLYPANIRYQYQALNKNEDKMLVEQFVKDGLKTIVENDPCIYIRMSHGFNTWSRRHIMVRYVNRKHVHVLSEQQSALVRKVVKLYEQ